jgi:hypothetical protein
VHQIILAFGKSSIQSVAQSCQKVPAKVHNHTRMI